AYDSEDTLSTSEQSTIQQYVNGGGAFFMASMEILSRVGPVAFRTNVLHAARFIPNPDPFFGGCDDCDEDHKVSEIEGVPQDPITDNVLANLDYSLYPDDIFGLGIGPDFSDTFGPTTNASPILFDYDSGRPCAMRFPRTGLDATGRVVFLSFPLDAIPENTPIPGNRAALLRRALQFLAPGLGGFGSLTLDRSTYTVPDFVTVELADSDLAGQGTATVTCYSTADATRRTVTINETPLPGLFRGFVRLIPAGATPGPGQLRAANGGTITLEYVDASAHQTVTATAAIDTQPPSISGVQAVAQYEEATISWDTTEDSDSQVLYGESILLGRSAFSDDLDSSHEVLLTGLRPNRTYYFKVVSRDAAGNVVEDDNGGNLYTFKTLPPLLPPFTDNMENSGTNWSVFNGDDTGTSWELGRPTTFYGVDAHSPTQAWGSNLRGQSIDTADTFLISPAIDLSQGNRANLHFWHNYDFTDVTEGDVLESGAVYVITNALSDPVPIAVFEDATADWEEVNIDLTPYIGHVVYLVWHYQMLSFESFPRFGWFVDDVSITATNVPPGTIMISNNLAQGPYVLTGPMNRNGRGSLSLTNAPPGVYSVTFGAVPYYFTPPAQTNTLLAQGPVLFRGHYTFNDANNNGISDDWEMHFFGNISASRTKFTDSDGDGATDYAEFIAGTSPVSSGSALKVAQPVRLPDGTYRIDWASISGKNYRLEGSTDAIHWSGVSPWVQATSSIMTYNIPAPSPGAPYLFRLQVQP
ncbi:MAG TPA: choice-of-anchor J domain-containing protein, partial [Candidatus Saccharimonadales bacterium]|nr:choice-of-anchor J domain-containing protein [Candidatus Saccharimonadales bacterium]